MTSPSRLAHDLTEAFRQPDCPVCRLIERDVQQYIDGFFYESITVVERRAEIRSARGFCPPHGAILAGHSRALGTAIMHHDVLNDVLRGFPGDNQENQRRTTPIQALQQAFAPLRQRVLQALQPKHVCVLCAHERHQERVVLEALLEGMRGQLMCSEFTHSGGLCLPHLRAALEIRSARAESARALIEAQGEIMRRLRDQLALFIHKNNGSYESSTIGEEAHAPARATRMVSGRKSRA